MDLVQKGSQTAKNGFKNEKDICNKFNSWEYDNEAKLWLNIMQYDLDEIENINASVLHGYKSDIYVQITIKFKSVIHTENIQVKLVSNKKGFNQVDKRWLSHYQEMWDIPPNVYRLLQYYTGEKIPYKKDVKDNRRMFINEFSTEEQQELLVWFENKKALILSDIIKGRGEFSAKWILVAQLFDNRTRWVLVNINEALRHYSSGSVKISPKGSIYIGHVTAQRKGGDNGRKTANMLQFKLDPTELFDL